MKKEILHPSVGVFRAVFLYVGQGESTLLIIPDGDKHQYVLVDSNNSEEEASVNIKELLKELENDGVVFINTHPHNDHIRGVADIKDSIFEVWHSGHMPSKKYGESYKELEEVIKKVGESNTYFLRGSRDLNTIHTDREETSKVIKKIGDAEYQIFSPAKYVCEEIDYENPEERKKRIHEQCGVIKFIYKGKNILLTGDSDKTAWKDYIVDYYKDNLKSDILSGSHHGSNSFFRENDDDDIYEDHVKVISPEYVVISAPKKKDSPHDHPDDKAMEIYKKYVGDENIFHLGEDEKSVIADIDSNGNLTVYKEEINTDKSSDDSVIYKTSGNLSRPYCSYEC